MAFHECVCFLVVSDGRVLLERRAATDRLGYAELNIPGGHMELGELQVDTLLREVEEELGIIPLSYEHLCKQHFVANEVQLLHYYAVTEWAGEVIAQEKAKIEWHPLANELPLSAADRVAINTAQSQIR